MGGGEKRGEERETDREGEGGTERGRDGEERKERGGREGDREGKRSRETPFIISHGLGRTKEKFFMGLSLHTNKNDYVLIIARADPSLKEKKKKKRKKGIYANSSPLKRHLHPLICK